jgi:hypothetical protein
MHFAALHVLTVYPWVGTRRLGLLKNVYGRQNTGKRGAVVGIDAAMLLDGRNHHNRHTHLTSY